MITADTITDEQIRELRDTARSYADGDPAFVIRVCERALNKPYLSEREREFAMGFGDDPVASWKRARARCAEILNAKRESNQ